MCPDDCSEDDNLDQRIRIIDCLKFLLFKVKMVRLYHTIHGGLRLRHTINICSSWKSVYALSLSICLWDIHSGWLLNIFVTRLNLHTLHYCARNFIVSWRNPQSADHFASIGQCLVCRVSVTMLDVTDSTGCTESTDQKWWCVMSCHEEIMLLKCWQWELVTLLCSRWVSDTGPVMKASVPCVPRVPHVSTLPLWSPLLRTGG